MTDSGLTTGLTYYYAAFAYDDVSNYSTADEAFQRLFSVWGDAVLGQSLWAP